MLHWRNLCICAVGCVFLIFVCFTETKKPPVGLISPGNSQTESNPGFNSTGLKHKTGHKHIQDSMNRTRIQIDLSGPNVCGTRCCPGWIVHPKTKKCTKSKCSPRCYNRPMCRKRSVCQCRLRSQHCKQNQTISSSEITPTPVTVPEAMPTYKTTPSPVPPTPARTDSKSMEKYSVHWKPLSLKEAQAMLMRKALVRAVGGNKIVNILLKHIEAERNRLQSCNCTDEKTSTKTLYTQQGQYTLIYTPAAERIKVLFTPTICRLRCSNGRCTNYCERGNITTLYSNEDATHTSGFRVFLCPMLCKNGGVCIQKDRCLCPSNFTGKFCHIPTSSSSPSANEIEKPSSGNFPASQGMMHSEYVLPLQSRQQNHTNGSPVVTVRVHHPLEATVKIHQVAKVTSGSGLETVWRSTGLSGSLGSQSHSSAILADRAEATPALVQAQTFRGDSIYTEVSGFKYCFREVRNGKCSSPLPGLRSQETCCKGDGLAWGIKECTLCPPISGSGTSGEKNCPKGFERVNGTQCVDINECMQPGFCENGKCVNTRGSYSCVCKPGFLLDASHGICISQKVISEEKDQCFRIVSQGSCSLPILKNITKQICCCSRVGKAWGRKCEACPYFGSVEFKEICPAGPGYHYSPNTLKLNPRVTESRSPALVSQNRTSTTVTRYDTSLLQSTTRNEPPQNQRPTRPQSATITHNVRIQQSSTGQRQPITSEVFIIQNEPQLSQHRQTGSPASSTSQPSRELPHKRVCEANPQVCGPGRCVDIPGGKHTCVCNPGFILNSQAGHCQDINECLLTPRLCLAGQCENTVGSFRCVCPSGYRSNVQQNLCTDIDECRLIPNPCTNGRCENTLGSFRCVCRTGYKIQNNTCTDIDECDDPLRCPGKECINTQGSYNCVPCKPGFGLLNGQCTDIDECRQRSSLCSNGRCENTPGSYRCVCNKGFKLQGNICTDVNECEDSLRCPGQECINTLGSYRCVSCGPGFAITNRRCTDIDECRQVPAPCANGRCENTPGSYRCVCHTGYKLQDNTCTDVNECENHLQCRGQVCVNTPGSYRCTSCGAGFSFHNGQCTDVDECAQNTRLCANGHCENIPGSFRCVCRPGFRLEANTCTDVDECENELQCPGQKCVNSVGSFKCVSCSPGFEIINGQCQDVDECRRTPSPCSNGRCENTPGSFMCVCRSGFKLRGNTCTDVDECESSGICGPKSVCVNTDGSYRCECLPGFRATGHGRQCRDINECSEGEFCFPRGECVNTEGSYKCVCSQGYHTNANGTLCHDVDECARDGVCEDGRCINTDGSFVCHCKVGFTANPEKTACLDVDECVDSGGSVCGSQRCKNTIGSFRCLVTCEPGYSLTATGECVDINECANESVCGHHMFCQNLIGTYQCICDQGYETAQDGRSCVDINECAVMAGVCGAARCWNVEGSFTCECENRQEEFDPLTRKCVSTGSGSGSSSPLRQPGEQIECYSRVDQRDQCAVLSSNTTVQECCCTVGRAWGLKCQYTLCPQIGTPEFQAMCPNGRGYVTSAVGAFSYRDVDECKLFDPDLCKGGVCVNNIPGYSCYCPSGYYYDTDLMECIDNDECESGDMCPGGQCVNTLGSHYCTCEPPLVLDDTQRSCVNNSGLTVDENLSFCWQHITADLVCQRLLQGIQMTFVDCCCLYGEAWGLQCALCPRRDEEAYEAMCSSFGPPRNSPRYAERFAPLPGGGGGYRTPYAAPIYPDLPSSDYNDYGAGTGRRSGLRTQSADSYTPYMPPGLGPGRYYEEEDYDSAAAPPFAPDPHTERFYDSRFVRPPLTEGEEDEESWRGPAPFPPFTDRRPGSERPQRVYERRYESFAGLPEDECGILQGCENGRCVRVGEGYTCDCYDGYQLDIASMTCLDVDECEDPTFPECINARCVNTEGSYRCVCLRGFIASRRPNYCIPA